MTVALPAEYRYGYRAQGPWEVLVYRRDMSRMRLDPGEEPVLEG